MVLSQAYLEWQQQTEQGAEARLVLRQLTRRIGDINPAVQSQIKSLSLSQIESLGEALLDFSESIELNHWLDSHSAD